MREAEHIGLRQIYVQFGHFQVTITNNIADFQIRKYKGKSKNVTKFNWPLKSVENF